MTASALNMSGQGSAIMARRLAWALVTWAPAAGHVALRALSPHAARTLLAALLMSLASPFVAEAGNEPALSDEARKVLRADEHLNDGLRAVVIADAIRNRCPSISGRLIRAFFFLKGLENYARKKGYREEDVSAFLQDRIERERVFNEARKYLEEHGAKEGDPESFCRVGRAEIEQGTPIGKLLKDHGK